MIKSFAISAKVRLNVHDLNNELSAGNVSDIRQIDVITLEGEIITVPAVSGRMLKHWHYEHYRQPFEPSELCDACRVGEPMRPGKLVNGKISQIEADDHETVKNAIEGCAVCDLHGYLIAKGNVSTRRNSRVLFSWLLPVLGVPTASRQVIHTRVSSTETEDKSQMIFNKSYASSDYGFVSYLDAERVGFYEDLGEYAVEDEKVRIKRVKNAVLAYLHMLTGRLGASQSHALPHTDVLSVLVAYSEEGQIPVPVSPIYPDYVEKTVGLMPEGAEIIGYGEAAEHEGVRGFKTLTELFGEVLGKLG